MVNGKSKFKFKEQKMKGKVSIIIALVSILLVGIVAFSGCKKKSEPAKPAAQTKVVEPNLPK